MKRALLITLLLAACSSEPRRVHHLPPHAIRVYADTNFLPAERDAISDAALDLYAETDRALRIRVDYSADLGPELREQLDTGALLLRVRPDSLLIPPSMTGTQTLGWARKDLRIAYVIPDLAGPTLPRVVAHELLHVLGVQHTDEGLMSAKMAGTHVTLSEADRRAYAEAMR